MSDKTAPIPIEYVGRRTSHVDTLYGTRLTFAPGVVHLVEPATARRMLSHKDVYAEGKRERAHSDAVAKPERKDDETEEAVNLAARDSVNAMGKDALAEYATVNFNRKLDMRLKVSELRAQVIGMIDQFGLP